MFLQNVLDVVSMNVCYVLFLPVYHFRPSMSFWSKVLRVMLENGVCFSSSPSESESQKNVGIVKKKCCSSAISAKLFAFIDWKALRGYTEGGF